MNLGEPEKKYENECVFKRGGWCTTHNVAGMKKIVAKKVWARKRDGTFAYLFRNTTKYLCSENGRSRDPGPERQKSNFENDYDCARALGGDISCTGVDRPTDMYGQSDSLPGLVGRFSESGRNTEFESESQEKAGNLNED